jgi:hypothetical protein
MLDPESRLPDARPLIEEGEYFVLHAPRQTGKTTTLAALARDLTAEGGHAVLHFSCERAEAAGDDYAAAGQELLAAIRAEALEHGFPEDWLPPSPWPEAPPGSRLHAGLTAWARRCPVPLTLLFDEIDALRGDSLRSVLRQLRDGFRNRPQSFPASVVLCGLRDVRDYRAAAGGDPSRLGTASPFNISAESLRMGDFTIDDCAELYAQHTAETGQEFTPEAVERAFCYTQGQPWLANAIAREITRKMRIAPPMPITAAHADEAKERLILTRATHLDSLASKLNEPRVKRIIEPLLAGTFPPLDETFDDDLAYTRDLGLIGSGKPPTVANPIYREVIARILGAGAEELMKLLPHTFLLPDGRLNFSKLLSEFAEFWKENGEILASNVPYQQAGPQVVMMAYLQRIVNGGGYVDREYGIGTGRIDLLVRKPYGDHRTQKEALEIKMRYAGQADPLPAGLKQLDGYLDRLGLSTGTLAVFDARPDAPPIAERTTISASQTPCGRTVTLFRG